MIYYLYQLISSGCRNCLSFAPQKRVTFKRLFLVERLVTLHNSPSPHHLFILLEISQLQRVLLELQQQSQWSWNGAGWCHLLMQTGDHSEFRSGHMASLRWHWDNSILLLCLQRHECTAKVEGGKIDFSELLPEKKQQLSPKGRLRWVVPILTHLWGGCSAQWEDLRSMHLRFLPG